MDKNYQQSDNHSSNTGLRIYTILATILALLAGGLAWKFWNTANTLTTENAVSEKQLDSLASVKADLDRQLDSLNKNYLSLRTENEGLQGAVARSEQLVQKKVAEITAIRQSSTRDADALRAQIAQMERAKAEIETVVTILRTENEQLKAENTRLTGENQQLRGEKDALSNKVGDLSKQLEEQIIRTHSAKFKASAFRVEVEKRGDKLTTKARRVREITISFDLADVPAPYQGATNLYLVITDEKATTIDSKNPKRVTVQAPAGAVDITALQTKQVNLQETQRLSFTYKLDEKLKKGNYVAAIYSDKGLLGASSFKLR